MRTKSAVLAFLLISSLTHVQTTKSFFCELVAAIVIYRLFVDDVRVHMCHCQRDNNELRRWIYEHEKRFAEMDKRIEKLIKNFQVHHPEMKLY